jgi:hypothetical protein
MGAWAVPDSLCHVFRARGRLIVGWLLCTGMVWWVVALSQHSMPGRRATLALAGFVLALIFLAQHADPSGPGPGLATFLPMFGLALVKLWLVGGANPACHRPFPARCPAFSPTSTLHHQRELARAIRQLYSH